MKGSRRVLLAAMLAASVAWPLTANAQAGSQLFRGEVWTFDEERNTVTLRDGGQTFRVNVSPDQVKRLRMHEIATVRGQLADPVPIDTIMTPTPALTAVPRGPIIEGGETSGTIASVDPRGLISLDTPHGRMTVWTARPDVAPGTPAVVRVTVQHVDLVPQAAAASLATSSQPAASVMTEPGDYASVTGRLLSVDSSGALTVESPRGPITVRVPDATGFRAGETVQVRTFVRAGG